MRSLAPIIVALAACHDASARDKPKPLPEPGPGERFGHDMLVRYHMHENFDLLRAIELLLVHGKLDEAKTLARAIAEAPDEPGLVAYAKRATDVRERAAALARATTNEDALRSEARLAQACADCHIDVGVTPEFAEPPPPPPDIASIKGRMARHRWATDRLWEGMVGNSDESWRAGLDMLAAAPLPVAELGAERSQLARELQLLADQARKTQATDQLRDRAREYGDILVICASCHATRQAERRAGAGT